MQRHCRITVPGLSVEDFSASRRRLRAEFPEIHDVVATTSPGTLLVLYTGRKDVDAWLDALLDLVATRQVTAGRRLLGRRAECLGGDDTAA
jgi:hypothetical protein